MKRILGVCLFATLLMACANTAQYGEEVGTLSETWNETTAEVGTFVSEVESQLSDWQKQFAAMEVSAEVRDELADEKIEQLQNIKAACSTHGESYTQLRGEVQEFARMWEEKTNLLEGLRNDVEAGNVPDDIDAVLSDLKTVMEEGGTKVNTWKEQLTAIRKNCMETCSEHARILEQTGDAS
jgi:chromosome segregation ATPase